MKNILYENQVHDLILNNVLIQKGFAEILEIEGDFELIHEDEYINGIIADFTVINNNKIRSIIEVKGGGINVTDYVRGIGQVFQYEYFKEKNIRPKSISYADKFNTVYTYPSSVITENQFNVGRFKYPESTIIIEINPINNAVRQISHKELETLSQAIENNMVTISQYYFRDNRIFEYYILLKHLLFCSMIGESKVDRKKMENEFLIKINTKNNKNWRNAFITLASLGLINSENFPTASGKNLAIMNYEEFAETIFNSYIKNYGEEIINCFDGKEKVILNNTEFSDKIRKKYKDRDVLYLTQSNSRYISSWMNIFKDDYGFIDYKARDSERILKYNPFELTVESFRGKIKNNSIAYEYIKKYEQLIKDGEYK